MKSIYTGVLLLKNKKKLFCTTGNHFVCSGEKEGLRDRKSKKVSINGIENRLIWGKNEKMFEIMTSLPYNGQVK